MYKIGDKIEILGVLGGHSMDWWKTGDIYELTQVSADRFSCKKPTGETNGWCWDKVNFRLIPKEEVIDNYSIY